MSESTSQIPLNAGTPAAPLPSAAADAAAAHTVPRLRLWPLVVIVALQWLVILVPAWVAPATMFHFYGGFLGPLVGGLAAVVWWVLGSRLGWMERWLGLVVFAGAGALAWLLADPTFPLMLLLVHALPIVTTALALWLVVTYLLRWPVRRAGLLL